MATSSNPFQHGKACAWLSELEHVISQVPEGYELHFAQNGQQLLLVDKSEYAKWIDQPFASLSSRPVAAITGPVPMRGADGD